MIETSTVLQIQCSITGAEDVGDYLSFESTSGKHLTQIKSPTAKYRNALSHHVSQSALIWNETQQRNECNFFLF
jgi:hypothetical protein